MRTLIVYTHPWEGSFNHFVLEQTIQHLQSQNDTIDVIDLHKDHFKPDYTAEDLRLFSRGEYDDPMAANYSERLKRADRLVLIFPIWWFGMPAMLKGFFDKVLLKHHTYDEVDHQLKGLLDIPEALILTTGNVSKEILAQLGDPIGTNLANAVLKTVGVHHTTWLHGQTIHLPESREQYLQEINAYFKNDVAQ